MIKSATHAMRESLFQKWKIWVYGYVKNVLKKDKKRRRSEEFKKNSDFQLNERL